MRRRRRASPAVADGLAAMLNAGVHPVIPASGSIGASDLCLLAYMGLALIGEGEAERAASGCRPRSRWSARG